MYENNLNFIVADYFWLLYMCAIAHTYDVDRILVGSFLHFYFNHMFGFPRILSHSLFIIVIASAYIYHRK